MSQVTGRMPRDTLGDGTRRRPWATLDDDPEPTSCASARLGAAAACFCDFSVALSTSSGSAPSAFASVGPDRETRRHLDARVDADGAFSTSSSDTWRRRRSRRPPARCLPRSSDVGTSMKEGCSVIAGLLVRTSCCEASRASRARLGSGRTQIQHLVLLDDAVTRVEKRVPLDLVLRDEQARSPTPREPPSASSADRRLQEVVQLAVLEPARGRAAVSSFAST